MEKPDTIKLAIKSLLEVVQSGAKNIDICYLEVSDPENLKYLDEKEIETIVAQIEKEKEEEAEKKKKERGGNAEGSS